MECQTPVFAKDSVRLSRKIHVFHVKYCAEIASWIGCHPNSKFIVTKSHSTQIKRIIIPIYSSAKIFKAYLLSYFLHIDLAQLSFVILLEVANFFEKHVNILYVCCRSVFPEPLPLVQMLLWISLPKYF